MKAFDGSKRFVVIEVNLPVNIGTHVFSITFYVVDILPEYKCFLGRPWIHAAGAVTSTLHRKLKFSADNKMVVVEGEEDIVVSHLESFGYLDIGGEVHETPF